MNLLSGLEKFGLKAEDTTNLFEEEKRVGVRRGLMRIVFFWIRRSAVLYAIRYLRRRWSKAAVLRDWNPTWICVRVTMESTP